MFSDIINIPDWINLTIFTEMVLIVFFSGVIRGYAGFGSSLAAAPLLAMIIPPKEVVPCMYVYSIVAGIQLVLKVWRSADWHSVKWLVVGATIGMPFGAWALMVLSAETIRLFIGVVVLIAVIGMIKEFKFKVVPPRWGIGIVGALSGLLNTSTSLNGPPVIIYFLSLPISNACSRASLIVYFLFCAFIGLIVNTSAGLVTSVTIPLSVITAPALLLGNWAGDYAFRHSSGNGYRKIALVILAVIAVVTIGKSIMEF